MGNHVQRVLDALDRGRRFITHDVWYVGRPGEAVPHGFVIKQVRVVILLMQNMVQDALMLRAAALTLTTLLSLVPVLIVTFLVIKQFDLGANISGMVTAWTGVSDRPLQGDPDRQVKEFIDLLVPGLTKPQETASQNGGAETGPGSPAASPETQADAGQTVTPEEYENPTDYLPLPHL